MAPFTAKSVLVAIALFIGSGIAWLTHPDKGSILAWLKPTAPAAMSAAGSYLAGYFVGWGAGVRSNSPRLSPASRLR